MNGIDFELEQEGINLGLPENCENTQIKPNPIVKIPQGKLEGFVLQSRESKDYYGFYGIPFAKKPKRFQPPERWENWEGILDATKARSRCTQVSLITRRIFGSEDCLFLNVFTPVLVSKHVIKSESQSNGLDSNLKTNQGSEGKLLPVMVFIYGGGYFVGGGDLYGGKYLVDQNVILVTFNYRTGALGFLNSGDGQVAGNMGLKDQVMCFKWIQENIKYFGGDKDDVTIFGESAGSACVHFHMLSNMSKGLFKKAIMQSGTALSPWAFTNNPVDKLKKLVHQLDPDCNLEDMSQMLHVLKVVDARTLAVQQMNLEEWKNIPIIYFSPSAEVVLEGSIQESFLTQSPLEIIQSGKIPNEVPIILGVNSREGAYKSVPTLKNPLKVNALNDNWNDESQTFLVFNKKNMKNHEEFSNAARQFYFGDQLITSDSDSRNRLTDLVSDRYFIHSTKTTAILHSSFHKEENPIYLYIFDYAGEFSYLNSLDTFETYGAAHADELQYLMNQKIFYSKIAPGSVDDFMIHKMTSMWTNFCKTGVPRHTGKDFNWLPQELIKGFREARPLKYYQIGLIDSMIDEPFQSRMAFWESLPYK